MCQLNKHVVDSDVVIEFHVLWFVSLIVLGAVLKSRSQSSSKLPTIAGMAFALIIFVVEGAVFFFSSFRAVFELAYISSLAFILRPTIAMFVLVPHSTSVIFLVALPIPLDFFFLSQCFWEFL